MRAASGPCVAVVAALESQGGEEKMKYLFRVASGVALAMAIAGAASAEKRGPPDVGHEVITVNDSLCREGQVWVESMGGCGTYAEVWKLCENFSAFGVRCEIRDAVLDEWLAGMGSPGQSEEGSDDAPPPDPQKPRYYEEIKNRTTCENYGGRWERAAGRAVCYGSILGFGVTSGSCFFTLGLSCALAPGAALGAGGACKYVCRGNTPVP
jgi:hypothetical protein